MAKILVSDDLWQRVEPLLPKTHRNRHVQYAGRKPIDDRRVFEGIVFALKTGVPWDSMPASSHWPSGVTCWRRLIEWHRAGVWKKLLQSILSELRSKRKLSLERTMVDSSSIRAVRGGEKTGQNPTDRGKFGSKHHILTDAHDIPLSIELTSANRHDITQLIQLVEAIPPIRGKCGRPKKLPRRVQGDKAYDSESHRRKLKKSISKQH